MPKVYNSLEAGTYYFIAYAYPSGSTAIGSDTLILFQPQALALGNSQISNQSCNPGGDGSIDLEISGGVLPYHFTWTGRSDTVAEIDSLGAGSYGFTVTDGNGCTFSSSVNVGTASAPEMTLQVSELNQWGYHINCGEDETAKVWATVAGNQSYTVNWNVRVIQGGFNDDFFGQQDSSSSSYSYFVSNMDSLVGVSSGWYKATASNSTGCSVTDSIEVKGPFKPGLQLGVICNPNFTTACQCPAAQVVLKPMGGVPPYTINGIEVEVQDTFPIFIDSLQLFLFQDQAGCSPNFGGSDTLEINPTLEELVQVCGSVYNTPLSLSSITKSSYPGGYNVAKNGGQDGSAELVAQGGCLDGRRYFIRKAGNPTFTELDGNSATQLSAGNYLAYVFSCDSTQVDSLAFTMTQPETLHAAIAVSYQTNCNGAVSATLFAQVSGGVGSYTYQWTQSTNGGQPTNVGEGYNLLNISSFASYYLKTTDANGDTSIAQINIQPAAQLSISANAVAKYGEYHTRCDVGDGEIEVQLSGGIAPYALHINGNIDMDGYTNGFSKDTTVNDTSFTLHGFGAGNVGISVQDAGGCNTNLSQNINLNKPDMPDVFITGTTKPNGYYVSCDTCTDAELTVVHGEVFEPLTYGWYEIPEELNHVTKIEGASIFQKDDFNSVTGEGMTPFATTASISHITPGSLNILVTKDALGCRANNQVMIEKPKPFTQGWALDGNTGLDTTAYIGTRDSVDVVLKSNGANNPQPQLRLKASGGVEVNGPISLNGQIKIPQLGAQNQSGGILAIGIDGTVTVAQNSDLWNLASNIFDCDLNDPEITPATWKYEIQRITTTCGNVGIGTSSPLQRLHVTDGHGLFDNNLLVKDGNLGIGTSEPNTKLEVNIQGNYTKALQLNNSGNSLFFVPKNGGYGYNNLSVEGDAGLFWSDGLGSGGKNQSAGFTIGPFKDSHNGIRIDGNGNVGIGANFPTSTLQVENNLGGISEITAKSISSSAYLKIDASGSIWRMGTNGGTSVFQLQKEIGNNSFQTALYIDNNLSTYFGLGSWNFNFSPARINISNLGKEAGLFIYQIEPERPGIKIVPDLNLSLETPVIEIWNNYDNNGMSESKRSFLVDKRGRVSCRSLHVTQNWWFDHVFEASYKRQSLIELEEYVKKHKHLPNMPTAIEIETNGLDIGTNIALQLKEIEEIYLHLFELKNEILALKKENEFLKRYIKK